MTARRNAESKQRSRERTRTEYRPNTARRKVESKQNADEEASTKYRPPTARRKVESKQTVDEEANAEYRRPKARQNADSEQVICEETQTENSPLTARGEKDSKQNVHQEAQMRIRNAVAVARRGVWGKRDLGQQKEGSDSLSVVGTGTADCPAWHVQACSPPVLSYSMAWRLALLFHSGPSSRLSPMRWSNRRRPYVRSRETRPLQQVRSWPWTRSYLRRRSISLSQHYFASCRCAYLVTLNTPTQTDSTGPNTQSNGRDIRAPITP